MVSKTIIVRTKQTQQQLNEGSFFNIFIKFGSIRKLTFCRIFNKNLNLKSVEAQINYFSLESAMMAIESQDPEIKDNKISIEFYCKQKSSDCCPSDQPVEELRSFNMRGQSIASGEMEGVEHSEDSQSEPKERKNQTEKGSIAEMKKNIAKCNFNHEPANLKLHRVL